MKMRVTCAHCGEPFAFDTSGDGVRLGGKVWESDGSASEPTEYYPECPKCRKRTTILNPKTGKN